MGSPGWWIAAECDWLWLVAAVCTDNSCWNGKNRMERLREERSSKKRGKYEQKWL